MSLVNTRLQAIRSQYANTLDKYEDRLSTYGAWMKFVEDTTDPESIVDADILAKAGISSGNTLDIPVIDGADVTITNARTCTIGKHFETNNGYFCNVSIWIHNDSWTILQQRNFLHG